MQDLTRTLIEEATSRLAMAEPARAADRDVLLQQAGDLPSRLRSHMIDLASSKATEFSPDILRLVVLAAKLAFILYGAGSAALQPYEKDVDDYRAFPSAAAAIRDYMAFRESHGG